ncbi:MAG: B12-binding domain-containing radical SAM protein [bacterium]|nr:B12-binding domain-containing radical SAM protein [bacterium]
MMKFLLVNPADLERKMFGFLQPQSLGYLASSIIMNGYDVQIIDAAKDRISPEKLATIVKREKFDVVGFYVLSPLIRSVRQYSDEIKKVSPDTIIVVGGPHPTFEPEHTLYFLKSVDFACVGDGEETLIKITKQKHNDIPNLVWRKNGEIVLNHREFVDVNRYPLPAWDLVRPDTYPPLPIGIFSEKTKIAQIVTTRGCPYPCSFCGVPAISGKIIRTREHKYIISEIELLVSKYRMEEIHIIDDNITIAPRKWLIGLLNSLIEANFPVRFALPSGIRVDLVDEQILELMKKAGFYAFALGIESYNQKTLDFMKKKLSIQKVIDKLKLIEKYKFHVQGNFIIGYPTENLRDMVRTISFSLSAPINKAGYFIFNPFPGTDEWRNIKGKYPIEMWDKIISTFNLYRSSKFVERKVGSLILRFIQAFAYFAFYVRPKFLLKNLRKIKSIAQLKVIFRIISSILTS